MARWAALRGDVRLRLTEGRGFLRAPTCSRSLGAPDLGSKKYSFLNSRIQLLTDFRRGVSCHPHSGVTRREAPKKPCRPCQNKPEPVPRSVVLLFQRSLGWQGKGQSDNLWLLGWKRAVGPAPFSATPALFSFYSWTLKVRTLYQSGKSSLEDDLHVVRYGLK